MALLGWPVLLASDTGKQGRHLTEDWNTAIKVTRRVPNTQTQFSTLQFVANLYCCAHFGQLVSCISQVAESSLIFMADEDGHQCVIGVRVPEYVLSPSPSHLNSCDSSSALGSTCSLLPHLLAAL